MARTGAQDRRQSVVAWHPTGPKALPESVVLAIGPLRRSQCGVDAEIGAESARESTRRGSRHGVGERRRSYDVKSGAGFAAFVNEAEQAFSREHTQWVARQQTQ
jgi:hypothetical protein